jgi:hypothetical protein
MGEGVLLGDYAKAGELGGIEEMLTPVSPKCMPYGLDSDGSMKSKS